MWRRRRRAAKRQRGVQALRAYLATLRLQAAWRKRIEYLCVRNTAAIGVQVRTALPAAPVHHTTSRAPLVAAAPRDCSAHGGGGGWLPTFASSRRRWLLPTPCSVCGEARQCASRSASGVTSSSYASTAHRRKPTCTRCSRSSMSAVTARSACPSSSTRTSRGTGPPGVACACRVAGTCARALTLAVAWAQCHATAREDGTVPEHR